MKTITDETFMTLLTDNDTCVVMFGASWCGPCRGIKRHLESIGSNNVAYFDIDSGQTPQKFGLRAVPTLIVFQNGEEVARSHKVTPQIRELLGV
jgi:thioredoxin 1